MKKLLILLLTATAAISAFAAGCSGSSDRTNGQHGNDDTRQQVTEDGETCPDGECKDMPAPELLPHIPKKRNDRLPPHIDPAPVPPHRPGK
ncbi:MAG: hypothetical protein K2G38_01395 [Clostridia bacterium]|nr:hypothetical protein [Clostridia bacterium]